MSRGYLDAASGQPLHPAAREALSAFADRSWADPYLSYHEGRVARQLLDAARETAASAVGVRPDEISFRRSGRDVAEQAIAGIVAGTVSTSYPQGSAYPQGSTYPPDSVGPEGSVYPVVAHPPGKVITTAVERSHVLDVANWESAGREAKVIGVDSLGTLSIEEFESVHAAHLAYAACVQLANVELGTLQPVDAVARIASSSELPLVVDATGALGYLDLPSGWSALFADAHSWAGPREMAILAVRSSARWRSPTPGGTESRPLDVDDVAGAVAAAAALDAVNRDRVKESARLSELVDRIRARVEAEVPDVEILGDPVHRLPHTVTFSCLYVDGEVLSAELDRLGFAIGSGSACASRTGLTSHVLEAIGSLTHGNVRVSLPIGCPEPVVDEFLAVLPEAVAGVRREAGIS